MHKPPTKAQIRYKAQAYLAGGLALYSPIGLLVVNIYPFFANNALSLTILSLHLIIGLGLTILGNSFLNNGYDLLRQVNDE